MKTVTKIQVSLNLKRITGTLYDDRYIFTGVLISS